MASVVADMSMSLDGFIADPADGVEHLFGWFGNGDVLVPTADARWTFHTSAASAAHLREALANNGALVCGRRLFDVANGWGGNHPTGVPVFVVTHTVPHGWPRDEAPFTFVTEGVENAVAQAEGGRGRQGRQHRQCQHRPAVPQRPAARRDLGQPGPGPPRVGHPLLRPSRRRADRAGGSAGHRGDGRDPPVLPPEASLKGLTGERVR